jgi:hypothetical protein
VPIRAAAGAKDQHVAAVLPRQRAGQHDALRQRRLQVLQAVDGEIHPPIGQRFMDFLGEQALAADVGEGAVLDPVARGGDGVFLEGVHIPQDRAEAGHEREEQPRLRQRKRRGAGADAQRQAAPAMRRCPPPGRTAGGGRDAGSGRNAGLRRGGVV